MRRATLCFIGFFIGILGYMFIPIPSFKFFAFIMPVFFLSMALSSEEEYLNMNVFMICLLLMLLFSSSFITMDAGDVAPDTLTNVRSPIHDPTPNNDSVSIIAILNQVTTSLSILAWVIIIGVPILLIIGVLWAFVSGKIGEATTGFVRVLAIIGIMVITFGIFNFIGFDPLGITTMVTDTYVGMADFLVSTPVGIYNGVSDMVSGLGLDLPEVEMPENLSFDMLIQTFNSLSYTEFMYTVNDALPLMMSFVCLIIGFSMVRKKWEEDIIEKLSKPLFAEEGKSKKKERQFYPSLNRKMLVYIIFITVSAFAIFLSYSKIYPQSNDETNYMYLGYFSVYLFMSFIPLIFLSRENNLYYRRSTLSNTLKGIIYGVAGLFLMTRFFFQELTMSAYSVINFNAEISYVINQFIFVAPSESLMFHIFIPSVFGSFVVVKTKKVLKRGYELDRNTELGLLDNRKEMLLRLEVIYKNQRSKRGITKELANIEKELNEINQEIRTLTNQEALMEIDFKSVFGRGNSLIIFLIGVFISNFIFAMMHWIVLISEGVDFFVFWTSGLGVIYISGGFWFTFIAYKYGWVSGILTHAIYNSQTIIFAIIFFGGSAI